MVLFVSKSSNLMKRFLYVIMCLACVAGMVACGPNREELQQEILNYEDSVSEMDIVLDTNVAAHMADLYIQYADKFAKDSLAPVYLFRAADVMASVGNVNRSVECLDRIIDNYPDYEDLGGCYFLKGFAFEMGERYDEAKAVYNEFVKRFPDHPLANDTRAMLPYIGMAPEQMLEQIIANSDNQADMLTQK